MTITPGPADIALAAAIYREFSAKPESQHIASEFALARLSALIAAAQPRSVLEIGAGIGTMTKLLLAHPAGIPWVVSTEDHPVCLTALARNIPAAYSGRWKRVANVAEAIACQAAYDLVIIDGTLADPRHYAIFTDGTWCFVEGNRNATRVALAEQLAKRGLVCPFTDYRRSRRFRLRWSAKPSAIPLPKITYKPQKGCHIGQVAIMDAAH